MSAPDRKAMLERAHPWLSVRRQCTLLALHRSGVYRPQPAEDEADLALMRRIDALFLARPYYSSRRVMATLRAEGLVVNRKRVQRLMRALGITALGPKPPTSKPTPGHKIYPYLLRDVQITRANQVWCADITYIPMQRGFLYLIAVMDWSSRAVLSWRLFEHDGGGVLRGSAGGGASGLRHPGDLRHRPGQPVYQRGLHRVVLKARVKISMDGRGRWMDNVFIERLWRSLKHEEVYLKG